MCGKFGEEGWLNKSGQVDRGDEVVWMAEVQRRVWTRTREASHIQGMF